MERPLWQMVWPFLQSSTGPPVLTEKDIVAAAARRVLGKVCLFLYFLFGKLSLSSKTGDFM